MASKGYRTCRVCDAADDFQIFGVREMMFGTREVFEYFMCSRCGCLQIGDIPDDMHRHYPPNYYSLSADQSKATQFSVRNWLQTKRCETALFDRGHKLNSLAKALVDFPQELFQHEAGIATGEAIKRARLKSFEAHILDVGSGVNSRWLNALQQLGFRELVGIDPFIERTIEVHGIRFIKGEISEHNSQYDLITFHHSLEHMPNQISALSAARRMLKIDGTVLVRIPLVSSTVWEHYGVNWVELDAPRHFYLHSRTSFLLAADRAGLEVFDIAYDSLDFEFYGSEQYLRDIPLTDPNSLWLNNKSTVFTDAERAKFRELAASANAESRGGRAGFYCRIKP